MTPNQAKIVIKNPCSENWDEMKADSGGRFCQSCQKSVIDFTSKTDLEIKAFLKDKQEENLCGRFYLHQVNRIRIEIDQNILVSDIPFWQKFLVVFLVCFGADFLGYDFVFAQTDSIPVKTEQIDSLASLPAVEADTTLDAADSLQKPAQPKKAAIKVLRWVPDFFPIVSGSITYIEPWFEKKTDKHPEIAFDNNPEEDTSTSKTGIAKTSNSEPIVPKRPRKKPAPIENAIIADSGERRKTKRS